MLKGADRRLKKLTDHRLLVGGGRWESDKQRHYAEWAWKALGAALTEVREEAVRMLREDHPSKAVAPDLLRKRDDARQDALPKLKRSIDETARATHASNGWRGGAPRQESLATACERAKLLDTAELVNISEELRNLEELKKAACCLQGEEIVAHCALRSCAVPTTSWRTRRTTRTEIQTRRRGGGEATPRGATSGQAAGARRRGRGQPTTGAWRTSGSWPSRPPRSCFISPTRLTSEILTP